MWVTDLDYVKKERDKVLELLKKKALLRQKSLLGIEIDDLFRPPTRGPVDIEAHDP